MLATGLQKTAFIILLILKNTDVQGQGVRGTSQGGKGDVSSGSAKTPGTGERECGRVPQRSSPELVMRSEDWIWRRGRVKIRSLATSFAYLLVWKAWLVGSQGMPTKVEGQDNWMSWEEGWRRSVFSAIDGHREEVCCRAGVEI